MAFTAFEDLFQPETMSGLVKRYAESVEGPICAPIFDGQARKDFPEGDSINWMQVDFSRGIAATVGADTPSPGIVKTKRTPRSAVLVDIKEHVDLSGRFLHLMNTPGLDTADAEATLGIELQSMATRLQNAREYMATKTLEGSLDFSAMPNSDFNHTLTFPVYDFAASASWATAATKIRSSELPTMRQKFRRKTGRHIGQCIAPQAVEGYLVANTEVQAFAKEVLSAQILQNSDIAASAIWNSLGGMLWKFSDVHYALDATPTTEAVMQTADEVIVLPSSGLNEVLGVAEGKVIVPAGAIYKAGAAGASSLLSVQRGYWAYAELVSNPIGIRVHAGWKGLFYVRQTNGVGLFDSTP